MQRESDSRSLNLQRQLQLKTFEHDRLCLVQEETQRELQGRTLERDKYASQVQLLKQELLNASLDMQARLTERERDCRNLKLQLETYEELEAKVSELLSKGFDIAGGEGSDSKAMSDGLLKALFTKANGDERLSLRKAILDLEGEKRDLAQALACREEELEELQARWKAWSEGFEPEDAKKLERFLQRELQEKLATR